MVEIFDKRTVASLFDTSNPAHNLTGERTIDICDLMTIAANFVFKYVPQTLEHSTVMKYSIFPFLRPGSDVEAQLNETQKSII